MSRAPLPFHQTAKTKEAEDDLRVMVHSLECDLKISDEKLVELKSLNQSDHLLSKLHHYVKIGWPENKKSLPKELHPYWSIRYDLYDRDGIIMKENQMVIPKSWVDYTLSKLHIGHFGIVKTKKRARGCVYWPNMTKDIENLCCLLYTSPSPRD